MIKKICFFALAAAIGFSFLFACAQEYFEVEPGDNTAEVQSAPEAKPAEEVKPAPAAEPAVAKPAEAKPAEIKKVERPKPQPEPKEESTYVGVESCKKCHAKEYEDFTKRKFDKAWKILEMRGEIDNPKCLKCHATGYGEPSGFVSEAATPHLKYKQCESCHGPGSVHKKKPMNKVAREEMRNHIRDKDVCIKCHVCMFTHKTGAF